MSTVDLPNIREPFIDGRTGQVSRPWWIWLQQLMTRIGGTNGTDLTALQAAVTALLALTAAQGNQIDGFVPLPPDTDEQADEGMVYVPPQDLAATSPVQSVFGRTSDVVAQSGDYSVGQVTNAASVLLTLAQFAATTSAQLRGVLTDETGTGSAVFGTSPTLTTPVIASIVNGGGTLTLPSSTDTLVGRATTDTLTNKTLTSPTVNSPTISGGTIDNTPVGATTANTGRFTVLNVTAGGAAVVGGLTVSSGGAGITGGLTMNTGAITPVQTSGITGTTTNNNAVAGAVGEYNTNSATGAALTNGTSANAVSISLTAGDWDVQGVVTTLQAGGAVVTQRSAGISTVSATLPASNAGAFVTANYSSAANAAEATDSPVVRISLSATTTVYLVAQVFFASGSVSANGFIRARRVR